MPWIQTPQSFFAGVGSRRATADSAHDLWSYLDARDAGQGFLRALEWQGEGHLRVLLSAADTFMEEETEALVRRVYPGIALVAADRRFRRRARHGPRARNDRLRARRSAAFLPKTRNPKMKRFDQERSSSPGGEGAPIGSAAVRRFLDEGDGRHPRRQRLGGGETGPLPRPGHHCDRSRRHRPEGRAPRRRNDGRDIRRAGCRIQQRRDFGRDAWFYHLPVRMQGIQSSASTCAASSSSCRRRFGR